MCEKASDVSESIFHAWSPWKIHEYLKVNGSGLVNATTLQHICDKKWVSMTNGLIKILKKFTVKASPSVRTVKCYLRIKKKPFSVEAVYMHDCNH